MSVNIDDFLMRLKQLKAQISEYEERRRERLLSDITEAISILQINELDSEIEDIRRKLSLLSVHHQQQNGEHVSSLLNC